MIARELHMDEARLEDKVFAPGYGELHSGRGRTFEATALAIPADARPGSVPTQLQTLSSVADAVVQAARTRNWSAASRSVEKINRAWDVFRASDVPTKLAGQMTQAIVAVNTAVHTQRARAAGEAALDVVGASLDLQLRYRPPAEIDLARLELRARQLVLDAAAGDVAGARGDIATLEWIRGRIELAGAAARRVDHQLRFLRAAAAADRLEAVRNAALRFRKLAASLR
jgi:hypothetical protein